MFKVGDKVSHPVHGAGVIKGIETKEVLGEKQKYYSIFIETNKMNLLVSTDKAGEAGIRKVMMKSQMDTILDRLTNEEVSVNKNWIERGRVNADRLKSGKINDVIMVLKELHAIDKEKGLSMSDKRLYNMATQILASELALVKNMDNEEAKKLMEDALNKNMYI